ncbi:MAG: site-specific integrase [Streptococcaceae bacterium]|jgi:integrase|nr:site-specific integrase [Streptococcaceae bacterium]
MYVEKLKNGKFRYGEIYLDPYTEKWRKTSIVLEKDTKPAKREAQRILNERIAILEKKKKESDITFRELYEEWFPIYQKQVKHSTWADMPELKKHIDTYIDGDTLVKNIDVDLVDKLIHSMYTFGKYSFNYTKKTKSRLSKILEYAKAKKYIERNPVREVSVVQKNEDKEKSKKKLDEKYLEPEEIDKLLTNLSNNSRRKLPFLVADFLLMTGLRFGELQALQYKHFDGKTIYVKGTLDTRYSSIEEAQVTTTKNISSTREVDLPDKAVMILNQLKFDREITFGKASEKDFIFVNANGQHFGLNNFNRILQKTAQEEGIDKDLKSHVLRHTHISTLAEMNIPIKAIMARVGHADASTTLEIYNHVTNKTRADVLKELNSYFPHVSHDLKK